MARIAINGFGRIGRLFFRQALASETLEVVALNDLGSAESLAYLLQYDTVYGRLEEKVIVKGDLLKVGKRSIHVVQEADPLALPWKKLDIDVVVESTGVFDSFQASRAHLKAGAKRVVITAPAKDEDGEGERTILMGVNEAALKGCSITSNGSCTTNATAIVLRVIDKAVGIRKAVLNTTHGYTASQSLVDSPGKHGRERRGRAAAQNIVPSSTGAALAVARALPALRGKFDGVALRVPVVAGSIADLTMVTKRATNVEEVNSALERAASDPGLKNILSTTREPLVSSDIIKEPCGAIVDLELTQVVDGDLVKVLSWYDNEWGYTATLLVHVEAVASQIT